MNKFKKENIKNLIIAIFSILIILLGVLFVYNFLFTEKTPTADKQLKIDEIQNFGTTPQETLSKFIYLAGNMGDPDDVNIDKLTNGSARSNNATRRYDSYKSTIDGIYSQSQLLDNDKGSDINSYTKTLQWAQYYKIDSDSIKVSEPKTEDSISTNLGEKMNTVSIYGSFTSTRTLFRLKTQDSSSDGTYIKSENTEEFNDIKFILVEESNNNWKVYSIDDNNVIGSRFSTWDTSLKDSIDYQKDENKGELTPSK